MINVQNSKKFELTNVVSLINYLKLEKFDGKSYVCLEAADLTTLYGLLEQAKAKM